MTIEEYNKQKSGLKSIYVATKKELQSMNGWESFRGNWKLSHVGINNDGSLTAVVHWGTPVVKDQWVGVSWENVIARIKRSNKN